MCKFCHRPAPFLNNANEAKSKRFFLFSNKSALKKITLISRVTHIPYLQRNGALLYFAFFHDLKGKFIKKCGLAGGAPLSCLQQRPSQRYVMYDSAERGMHVGKLTTPESHSTLPSCAVLSQSTFGEMCWADTRRKIWLYVAIRIVMWAIGGGASSTAIWLSRQHTNFEPLFVYANCHIPLANAAVSMDGYKAGWKIK